MHLHESAKRVLNEEASKRNTEILREAFQYDVRRLEEARACVDNLLNEGVLSESAHRTISDHDLLNEDFEDLKADVARQRRERAAAGLPPLPGEAREIKAKAKEAARRAASAPANVVPVNFGRRSADEPPVISEPRGSTGTAPAASGLLARIGAAAQKSKDILANVRKGANLPPIINRTAAKAKEAAPAPGAAAPAGETAAKQTSKQPSVIPPPVPQDTPAAPRVISAKSTPPPVPQQTASAAVGQEAMMKAVMAMAENDPANFKKLVDIANGPGGVKKVEALLNKPEAKAEAESIKDELANSPEAKKSPGFLDKIKSRVSKTGAFAKKHPIMFWGGLGLIATIGGLAVVGAGGVGALATAVIAKVAAAKGIVAVAAIGGTAVSGAKEVIAQKKAGGKFQWGKVAKQAAVGGIKAAGKAIATIGATAVAGEALKGASKIGSGIVNAATPPAGAPPAAAAPVAAAATATSEYTHEHELNGSKYYSKIDANGTMDNAIKNITRGSSAGDDGVESLKMHLNLIQTGEEAGYPNLKKLFAGQSGEDCKYSIDSMMDGLNPADQHQLLQLAEKDPQNLIKLARDFEGKSATTGYVDTIKAALNNTDTAASVAASAENVAAGRAAAADMDTKSMAVANPARGPATASAPTPSFHLTADNDDYTSMAQEYYDFANSAEGRRTSVDTIRVFLSNKGLSPADVNKFYDEIRGSGSKANAFHQLELGYTFGNDSLPKRFKDAFLAIKPNWRPH